MSVQDEMALAETLRSLFVEKCPFLPVKGGSFSLDGLLPDQESMSLQMNGGQTLYQFIDGTRVMLQPFTIFYRGEITADNDVKSAMLGVLNALGAWMDDIMHEDPPYLGNWLSVNKFEQVQSANISDQTEKFLTYQAGYALGYETLT